MNKRQLAKLKKLLVNILAKNPGEFFIVSENEDGWVSISDVHKALMEIDATFITPKGLLQYFSLYRPVEFQVDADKSMVRARPEIVKDGLFSYTPKNPPPYLFVPIRPKAYFSVEKRGIGPQGKVWLPLLASRRRAKTYGKRFHQSPLIIKVLSETAHSLGHAFYYAGSELYLTDSWIEPTLLEMPRAPVRRKQEESVDNVRKRGKREKKDGVNKNRYEKCQESEDEKTILPGTFMPSIEAFENFYREKERRARKRAKKAKIKKKKGNKR